MHTKYVTTRKSENGFLILLNSVCVGQVLKWLYLDIGIRSACAKYSTPRKIICVIILGSFVIPFLLAAGLPHTDFHQIHMKHTPRKTSFSFLNGLEPTFLGRRIGYKNKLTNKFMMMLTIIVDIYWYFKFGIPEVMGVMPCCRS